MFHPGHFVLKVYNLPKRIIFSGKLHMFYGRFCSLWFFLFTLIYWHRFGWFGMEHVKQIRYSTPFDPWMVWSNHATCLVHQSGQIIIFHQPRFPWLFGDFPYSTTFWGEVVWGRYNLTRPIILRFDLLSVFIVHHVSQNTPFLCPKNTDYAAVFN